MRKYVMDYNYRLYQTMLGYQTFKATLQLRAYFLCMEREGKLYV